MNHSIEKDSIWLEEQVRMAVRGLLEQEMDRLTERLVSVVSEQINFAGSLSAMKEDALQNGELVIRIPLPNPEDVLE